MEIRQEELIINIKKTNELATIPKYAHSTDAGMDLVAVSMNDTDEYIEYDTGIALEIPKGYVGLVFPRSSVSKLDLVQANSVGVIDSSYRNSIKVRFKKLKDDGVCRYVPGERIAQLIILPYPMIGFNEVEKLSDSDRGLGGFGSTGK